MRILLVAAVEMEIAPLLEHYSVSKQSGIEQLSIAEHLVDILLPGIGLTFSSYLITKQLSKQKYDLVINIGIAGAFDQSLEIGHVAQVTRDEFADLAVEDGDLLRTLFEMDFLSANNFPFDHGKLINKEYPVGLPAVSAISVNTAHGKEESVDLFRCKFQSQLETMEGAAVFYVCKLEKVPVMQIRAISNYVELRNKAEWNIPLAIKNLNAELIRILELKTNFTHKIEIE